MSNVLTFAEIDGQHVEILPARTVLTTLPTIETGDMTAGDTNTESDINASQEAKDVKGDVWQLQYIDATTSPIGGAGLGDVTFPVEK